MKKLLLTCVLLAACTLSNHLFAQCQTGDVPVTINLDDDPNDGVFTFPTENNCLCVTFTSPTRSQALLKIGRGEGNCSGQGNLDLVGLDPASETLVDLPFTVRVCRETGGPPSTNPISYCTTVPDPCDDVECDPNEVCIDGECVCDLSDEDCDENYAVDDEICECVCDLRPSDCADNERLDEDNCECVCDVTPQDCADVGKVFDEENCTCECEDVTCNPNEIFDPVTCECLCDLICDAPYELDPGSCECICPIAPEDCDPNQTFNADLCECEDDPVDPCLTVECPQGTVCDNGTCICDESIDSDNDGVPDCDDICPNGDDRDDSDGDGIPDMCDDSDCGCKYPNQWILVCQDGKTRRVTCSALTDPNTYCGPCRNECDEYRTPCDDGDPCTENDRINVLCICRGDLIDYNDNDICDLEEEECNSCVPDVDGKITFCYVPLNPDNMRTVRGDCDDLESYFNEDGSFKNENNVCGPCYCELIGDVDSDGDGVCDRKDECPDNPEKDKAGMCGCDDDDSDKDWVCDSEDVCPGWNDKKDDDGDGVPNGCDLCEGSDDSIDENENGIPDGCDVTICCYASGNSEYEWIENTKFNMVFTESGDDGGYGDYRHISIMAVKGDSLDIWVTPGYLDVICELSVGVFVDWNGDYDFDDEDETVFLGRGLEETGTTIIVPEDAIVGDVCMRVIVDYGRIHGACDACIDGEVEDYVLSIKEASCDGVYEDFDYMLDSDIQGLEGGIGWTSAWAANKEGNAKARVLQNSLIYTPLQKSGEKLGVMNEPGLLLSIKRGLDFTPEGNEIWMSFLYMRDGGEGLFFVESGNFVLDVNSEGNFWIGDVQGPPATNGETYLILVKMELEEGDDQIYLWINPDTDSEPEVSDALSATAELGRTLEDLDMTFRSIDDSDAIYQYVDEVRVGCSWSDVIVEEASGNNQSTSTAVNASFILAPNPAYVGTSVGVVLNNATIFNGEMNLYTHDGGYVMSSAIYAGQNRLNTSDLQAGIYIIEIKTGNAVLTERLLIQN